MEISNIENWYCENMTMFHEAAFLKLILFKHEMLEMTNRAQRDMTILPPQNSTMQVWLWHFSLSAALSCFNTPFSSVSHCLGTCAGEAAVMQGFLHMLP